MKVESLKLSGTFEVMLEPKGDHRGYFMRTYDREIFHEAGLTTDWVQENQSLSVEAHTLRGLHYQVPPHAETKLVRALSGRIMDVFLDLRAGSPTFGQWDCLELSSVKYNAVYIPRGFAHGFCTLTENCVISYKVDSFYAPEQESGVRWDDPDLAIPWPAAAPVLSERDKGLPLLKDTSPLTLEHPQ